MCVYYNGAFSEDANNANRTGVPFFTKQNGYRAYKFVVNTARYLLSVRPNVIK